MATRDNNNAHVQAYEKNQAFRERMHGKQTRLNEASVNTPATSKRAKQRRWDNVYNPSQSKKILGVINVGNKAFEHRKGYGLGFNEWKNATATEHLARGAMFTFGGSGAKRTDLMNAMGFVTKHQKQAVYDSSKAVSKNRFSIGARTGKRMGQLGNMATTGFGMFGVMSTMADGGHAGDYLADFVLPAIAIPAGWRAGSSMGFAAGAMLSKNSAVAKGVLGVGAGVVGAGVATLGAVGAMSLINTAGDSNNFIKSMAHDIKTPDMVRGFSGHSGTQMNFARDRTSRMRAMNKLSKSSLNDRGQLMGNEAMVMRGLM